MAVNINQFADSDYGVLNFDAEIYSVKEIRFFDTGSSYPVYINKDGMQIGSLNVGGALDSDIPDFRARILTLETNADSDVANIAQLRRDADSDSIVLQSLKTAADSDVAAIAALRADIDSDGALQTRVTTLESRADSDETKIQALQETVDGLSSGNPALALTYGHRATLTGPSNYLINTIDNVNGGLVMARNGSVTHITVRAEVTDGAAGGRTVDYKLFVNDSDTGRAVQISAASVGTKTQATDVTDFTCSAGDEIAIKANASDGTIKVKAGAVMVRYQES